MSRDHGEYFALARDLSYAAAGQCPPSTPMPVDPSWLADAETDVELARDVTDALEHKRVRLLLADLDDRMAA